MPPVLVSWPPPSILFPDHHSQRPCHLTLCSQMSLSRPVSKCTLQVLTCRSQCLRNVEKIDCSPALFPYSCFPFLCLWLSWYTEQLLQKPCAPQLIKLPKMYCHSHKSQLPPYILSQRNPVHIAPCDFSKVSVVFSKPYLALPSGQNSACAFPLRLLPCFSHSPRLIETPQPSHGTKIWCCVYMWKT
jgi:hypothetical protein